MLQLYKCHWWLGKGADFTLYQSWVKVGWGWGRAKLMFTCYVYCLKVNFKSMHTITHLHAYSYTPACTQIHPCIHINTDLYAYMHTYTAISTFSPTGSLSSDGLRVHLCLCMWHWHSTEWTDIYMLICQCSAYFRFIPYAHTRTFSYYLRTANQWG